jgi:hypothetical protein
MALLICTVTPAFFYDTDRKQLMVKQDYSSIKKKIQNRAQHRSTGAIPID